MPVLSCILRNVLSDKSDCCFLCFNAISEIETTYNIEDEVSLGIDIETTEVLYEIIYTVLGAKVLDSISAHDKICQKCTGTVINCYKFIQQCRQNVEQLHCAIDSLQKHAQNISSGNYDNNSLFFVLDTSNYNVELYDKHRNINNQILLCKRFQRIYKEDSQQIYFDIDVESNNSLDDKNCAVKRRKQSSVLQSIEIAHIVHDKDDLNNLKCKTCLKLCPTVMKMKQHYLRVHAPKDFKCSQCPRRFGSSLILKRHTKVFHCTAVCSQCGKTYTNLFSLRRHERRHSKLCLVCHTCGKVYKGKQSFNNHIEKKLCHKMRKSNAEAKLTCDYCGKKYAQKAALNVHIRLEHLNGKAVICDWCGKKFGCMSRLKEHILIHTKERNFECERCGGKFVTKRSLLYHTRTHTGDKPYKCDQCERTFLSPSRRSEHLKRHHAQSIVECDICHGKFKDNSYLNKHRRKHFDVRSRLYSNTPASVTSAASDTSNYNVKLCYDKPQNINNQTLLCKSFQRINKDFQQIEIEVESNNSSDNNNYALKRGKQSILQSIDLAHIVHDKDDLNNLKCKTCLKLYPTVTKIKQHYLRVHAPKDFNNKNCAVRRRKQGSVLESIEIADIVHDKDDLNNLKCKTCLKLYPTVTKMKQHYLRVHAPKDFKCSQCPRSFGSSLILKQHTKDSHSTAVCSQCGKTYTNLYSLRRHEQGHSKLHLICHTCGKVYKGKRSFNNHIEKQLCEKMRKSNAEAKLTCDYCGKKYAQKGALRVHIRIQHLNGKAEICDWCGKKYDCISRLKDHILKHTKQKNFECEQCGGKFVTKTSLLYHTRTHTGDKPYKCEQCERTFLSASRRSEHVKRHHTKSNVECDICHEKFKGSLSRHRKKHFNVRSRLYCNPPASVV